jgi:hypothetical protein
MPDNLAALTDRLQDLLADTGSQFPDATCTTAIRQALSQFNTTAPIHAGTLIDAVAGAFEYELDDPAFDGLLDVTGVFYNPSGIEGNAAQVQCQTYFQDNAPFVRLSNSLPAGTAVLDVRFTLPHTIEDLDSATEGTLTADQEQVLIVGAAAAACFIRATDRTETVNMNQGTAAEWCKTADVYTAEFRRGLIRYARRQAPNPAPNTPGMPGAHDGWNDEWHRWMG